MKPSDIQNLVERRIRSFPEFSGIRIILEHEGDIETKIDSALKTAGGDCKPGVALVIGTASGSIRQLQAARLVIDPLNVSITAVECALFNKPPNGTGRRAGDLAVLAAAALIGWTPDGCGRPMGSSSGNNVKEAGNEKGDAAASVVLTTSLEMPLLRKPGEHGFSAPK